MHDNIQTHTSDLRPISYSSRFPLFKNDLCCSKADIMAGAKISSATLSRIGSHRSPINPNVRAAFHWQEVSAGTVFL